MSNYAINSLAFDSDTHVFTLPYGSCSTAAATAAKTVTVDNFSLETGASVIVKFTVTNTASSPTLNVNSTGAKAIYYKGAAITAGYLAANKTYTFIYNGTQWDLVGDVDNNSDTKVKQSSNTGSSAIPILMAYQASPTSGTAGVANYNTGVTITPSTKTITATTFVGALSGNASTATTATKIGTTDVGSATQPVYIKAGVPTTCTYTLGKSVPSNAKFTDTVYTHPSDGGEGGTVSGSDGQLSHGGTFSIPSITFNAAGHVISTNSTTCTLPAATEHIVTLSGDVTGSGSTSSGNISISTTLSKVFTANRLMYANSSGVLSAFSAPSTSNSVLRQSSSGAPFWDTTTPIVQVVSSLPSSPTSGVLYVVPASSLNESSPYVLGSSAPTDTTRIWIDTANSNIPKVYNGSSWITLGSVWS